MAPQAPQPPQPPEELPWSERFTRIVQTTGYIGFVFVIVFWALTERVQIEIIGASSTLLAYGIARSGLRDFAEAKGR